MLEVQFTETSDAEEVDSIGPIFSERPVVVVNVDDGRYDDEDVIQVLQIWD